jgi:hypothetical protein
MGIIHIPHRRPSQNRFGVGNFEVDHSARAVVKHATQAQQQLPWVWKMLENMTAANEIGRPIDVFLRVQVPHKGNLAGNVSGALAVITRIESETLIIARLAKHLQGRIAHTS